MFTTLCIVAVVFVVALAVILAAHSGTIRTNVQLSKTTTVGPATAATPIGFGTGLNFSFSDGTGANQINRSYLASRTLAGGANEDLDVAGGLTDEYGTTITMTAVKILIVKNTGTVGITMKPAAANGLATIFSAGDHKIAAGAQMSFINPSAAGWVVTAGTGDKLNFLNDSGGTSATYDILIGGIA